MLESAITQLIVSILGGISTALLAFMAWIIQRYVNRRDASEEQHLKVTQENTLKVAILTTKIDEMLEKIRNIDKMKEDINALHAWKRSIHEGES